MDLNINTANAIGLQALYSALHLMNSVRTSLNSPPTNTQTEALSHSNSQSFAFPTYPTPTLSQIMQIKSVKKKKLITNQETNQALL